MEEFKLIWYEFRSNMLGEITIAQYLAGFVFASIGAFLSLKKFVDKRDINSENTPREFCWKFFFLDNIDRLVYGFLIVFVCFRFAPGILENQYNMLFAIFIGLSADQSVELVDKFKKMARNKLGLTKIDNIE